MEQASGKAQGVYAYAPYQAYALLARPACVFGVVCAHDSGTGSPGAFSVFQFNAERRKPWRERAKTTVTATAKTRRINR